MTCIEQTSANHVLKRNLLSFVISYLNYVIVNWAETRSKQKQLCETAEELMNVLEKLQDDTGIGVVEADLVHAIAASERFFGGIVQYR